MFEPTNLTEYVGKPLTALRESGRHDEVYVFDHQACNHTLHFFKNKTTRCTAVGVVVSRSTNNIERLLPSLAIMDKAGTRKHFLARDCVKPIYTMLGEIAFRKWLADADMREAMAKGQHSVIKLRDTLFYSLLVYHGVARASLPNNRKGLWPFKIFTWDTSVRFQYRGKERYAHRRLTYIFADFPALAGRVRAEYRIPGGRKGHNLPDLTLSRNYPVGEWANTKAFMSQIENIAYLDAFFDEIDAKKK